MEKDVYIADYEHLGVYGCRILVPSMSEIYLSEDLVYDNNNSANPLRKNILGIHKLNIEEKAQLLMDINEAGFADMLLVTHALGVISDVNTVWANLRFGELRAMLALSTGNFEEAKTSIDWALYFAPLSEAKKTLWLCMQTMIQFKLEDTRTLHNYSDSLNSIYFNISPEI